MSHPELKVPPDVVWVVVAGLMWLAAGRTPHVELPQLLRVGTAAALTAVGIWAMVSARTALDRAKTTWRPMTPTRSTKLVDSGVYALSRNPIYLGMLLVMFGWAVLLASPAALIVSAVFVAYLDRFQIGPEERALTSVLGQEYADYTARVRRWV